MLRTQAMRCAQPTPWFAVKCSMQSVKWIVWFGSAVLAENASVCLRAAETNHVSAPVTQSTTDPRSKIELRREEFEKLTPEQLAALQRRRWQRIEDRLLLLRKKKESGKLTPKETEQLADLEDFKKQHTPVVLQPLVPQTSASTIKPHQPPPAQTILGAKERRTLKRLSAP